MKKKVVAVFMSVVFLIMSLSGCGNDNKTSNSNESYDGTLVYDYSMKLDYAKLFSVDYYKGGYKMITINNRDEDTAIISKETKILLVPEGMKTPADMSSDVIVLNTPVTNMLVSSTPVISLLNASDCLESVSQVTEDKSTWYIDNVKEAFDQKKLTYIGSYKDPDYEIIVAGAPTLAIYSTMLSSAPETASKLKELGVTYILDQSTYEEEPLGRVEWAKLYSALCNKEENADKMFNEQAAYVNALKNKENTGKSVAVFYITSKGLIYVRNSSDYLAKMVEIAGGNYIYSDLNKGKTGTQSVSPENFYADAKDADYIIYIWSMGGKPSTMNDFIGYNSILSDFKAVKEGNVWCTSPEYFQITNAIGSMINDMHNMLTADANVDTFTYLKKLK